MNYVLLIMMMIIFLLGALHEKFQYESTFSEDLNKSLGIAGSSFYKIYEKGEENPKIWIFSFFIVLIYSIYSVIMDIISFIKENSIQMKGGEKE